MAANTGPDSNTYIIPEVDLADTFNVWRDTTNTQTFKLNKMRVYDGVSSDTIEVTVGGGGTLQAQLASTINKGLTFTQPVVFSNGVTFNGDVTFNAQTFTVNANNVTIDDYAIVLGATLGANDTNINAAGGGGLLLNRGGSTAAWVWRADTIQGFTGVWNANAHIGLCGATAGLYPDQGGVLPIHGSGIRLAGSASGTHGLQMNLTNGSGSDSVVSMLRYSPAGSTVFAEVLNGTTYGSRPFFNIPNGANRKMVRTVSAHGFDFGTAVRLDSSGNYIRARADSSENAEVVGIVSRIDGARDFELTFIGEIFGDFSPVIEGGVPGSSQLQTGKTYYLSPNEGGKITSVQPTTAGLVHKAVLIATGPSSATVIPFTGGLLASTVTVSTVSSVATRLKQLNRFKVGDILRFKAVPGGITLTYNLSDRVVQERYTHGVYYRAQADTAEDATVAGMVIRVDEPEKGSNYQTNPQDVVWREFDILMDGWFDGLSNLTPGNEYWLSVGAVGNGPAGEGTNPSYSPTEPGGSGQVVKKLFMATTPTSGYLYSYRGDVINPVIEYVEVENPLIKNLASGISGDLRIGVYNDGVNGGRPSIIISKTPTTTDGVGSKIGNVGIGLDQWSLYQSGGNGKRILAGLDLVGWMRVGSTLADATPAGRDLIVDRIGNDSDPANVAVPQCRIVLGSDHTRGNAVLGYKVRPSATTPNTFTSSISGTHDRSALVLGTDGSNPSISLLTAKASSAAAGTNVTMTNIVNIVGSATPYVSVNGRLGIGNSSPQVALDVSGLARSSATVAEITDPQHLATKGYVDSQGKGVEREIVVLDTPSGTWTVPDNVYTIMVEVIGGGGGGISTRASSGGSGQPLGAQASGGRGGRRTVKFGVTPGMSFQYTIGGGGLSNGSLGGTSSFMGIIALGGSPATGSGNSATPGTEGSSSIGTLPTGVTLIRDFKKFVTTFLVIDFDGSVYRETSPLQWNFTNTVAYVPGQPGGPRFANTSHSAGQYRTAGVGGAIIIEYYRRF